VWLLAFPELPGVGAPGSAEISQLLCRKLPGVCRGRRGYDLGFDWFNRHFDIEKKPLQSIGLVAGALVAVVYWTAVVVSRVVG